VLFILSDEFRPDALGIAGNPLRPTPNLDALARESARIEKCFVQAAPCGPSRMCIYTGRYLCSTGSTDNMTPLAEAEDNLAMHLRRHGHRPALMGYNDYACDPRTLPEGHPHRSSLSYQYTLPGFDIALAHDPEYDYQAWFEDLRAKGYPEEWLNADAMETLQEPADGLDGHLPCHYPARYTAEDSETLFLTRGAIAFVKEKKQDGWFLSLNYVKPHGPYVCPAPYHALFDPSTMTEPVRRDAEMTHPHPYFPRIATNNLGQLRGEIEWRELRACYYGMVAELDSCLGLLFQALKDSGQWDDTLIIFSADHGTHLGDHWLTGKSHYYDQALRVPYIIRDPSPEADTTRGRSLDVFCEAIDSAPTICEYLGAPPHERFQGQSLLGLLRGQSGVQSRPRVHHEYYYYNTLQEDVRTHVNPDACRLWTVRDDRFKYVQFGEEVLPPLLFDLQADPNEFENLADRPEYAPVIAEYCQHLIRWRIRNEDTRMERWAIPYRRNL
jgi:arylsulfatase A-like enzyme